MNLKLLIKKLIYREKADSESYVKYLKSKGVLVGDGTMFFSPKTTRIDVQRPWLLEIGKDVQFAGGVTILTHGYDWSVLKGKYGDIIGSSNKVKIGNNCFIGANSTILKGVEIGDNCIIGACSVVTKNVESNSVFVGNPAKKICTIEEYYEKRKKKYLEDAKITALEYYKRYNKVPPKEVMDEFFWLFENYESYKNNQSYVEKMKLVRNEEISINKMKNEKQIFENYDEFLKFCGIQRNRRS